MPAAPGGNKASTILVAFTPRQVLLRTQAMKLNREHKLLLHQSIAHYLERSGFSKTLKKFRSEAEIKKDNLEGPSVDLEEMCLKYLEILGKDARSNDNNQKEQDVGVQSKNKEEGNLIADVENTSKNKKKKNDKSDSGASVRQSGTDESCKDSENSGEKTSDSGPESKVKSKEKDNDNKCKEKKKKKTKLVSESLANKVEDNQLESPNMVTEVKVKDGVSADAKTVFGAETEKRSKDKKKKKDKSSCHGDAKEQIGDPNETVSTENFKASNEEVTDKEKKDSKKRKRPTSEENDQHVADSMADEEPKRRKIENLNESKGGKQSTKTNANLGSDLNSNKENIGVIGQVGGDQLQKISGNRTIGKANGNLENVGEKSSVHRSQKKQQKESVEPKSVSAFQRVKIDEAVFADERLQDNSYWAKDGAENGYGAKAEEILGQVRGRDFRHEKTKKKRGTYRGGQIDLQSHSIKFNDSDED